MNPNQALWEKGHFTRIAAAMRDSGTEQVARLGIAPGDQVLDLGCGDGTTALPAARLGAHVTGVDIARNLLEAGERRAQAEGLAHCRFQHGDASDLAGVPDGRFDWVVSYFGAMFASDPTRTAREIVRVTRPGGTIVLGNWIPGDPTLVAQILRISASYAPPPPAGFISPMTWGVEAEVRGRFGAAGIPDGHIGLERAFYTFRHPGPARSFMGLFRDYYGPTMNAFAAARAAGREAQLEQELGELFETHNTSGHADATLITAAFMRVTVRKPG